MSVHRRATKRGTRYDVRLRTPEGRHYKRTFRTKRDAEEFVARERADRSRGTWQDPVVGSIPFEDWANQWLENCEGKRPKTIARNEDAVRLHLVPAFSCRSLASLTPRDVQGLVNGLAN